MSGKENFLHIHILIINFLNLFKSNFLYCKNDRETLTMMSTQYMDENRGEYF